MFGNDLKLAIRSLLKHRAYALTNLVGLAVGLAAVILILLYVQFELSFDAFHTQADSLYRVSVRDEKAGKIISDSPYFTPPIGPAMQQEFPEVERFVRLSSQRTAYLSAGERAFKVSGIRHADSTLFALFSFELLAGNPATALAEPYSIVLTPDVARRLFGEAGAIGRTLKYNNRDSYRVTGIVRQPPPNSHLQFNALISFATLYSDPNNFMDWNGGNQYVTYVKLVDTARPAAVEKKFPDFMWQHINKDYANYGIRLEPYLQPLAAIHLRYNPDSATLRTNLFVFSAVAVLILLIAGINFINLTLARAAKRLREIGIRKVVGASRRDLVRQFIGESLLLSSVALVFALLLVELFLPVYAGLLNREMHLGTVLSGSGFAPLFLLLLVVGTLPGAYPALVLASFRTVPILKGEIRPGARRSRLRNLLVIFQFAISIALIAGTLVVNRQLGYMKNKALGFDRENIVVLPLIGDAAQEQETLLKTELLRVPGVRRAAASSDVPYKGLTSNGYFPEGHKKTMIIHVLDVDEDFLATFDLALVKGRNFSHEFAKDRSAYLINEALARTLGWDDPLGKTIRRNGEHEVIGVVRDFHFASLHSRIEPLILTNRPWRNRFSHLSLKISGAQLQATLAAIRKIWQDIVPEAPFDYWFLDAAFDVLYKSEQRFQQIFLYFSLLAIFIALLGLFGLAAFAAERRTKEIGIRKVLGATVANVVTLLSKDFVKLVLLANLIAWPVAWYAMNKWLHPDLFGIAYRIDIGWWIFLLAGGLALVIALLTLSTQAIRAALANPVESLRYE